MSLTLKIAAGIVLGLGIVYLIRVLFVLGLLAGFSHYVSQLTASSRPAFHVARPPRPAQHNTGSAEAQIDAEAAREQTQKSRCMIKKADGTVLYCDPRGPFTPR